MDEKNLGGRPPHYNSAEELQERVDQYFEYIKGENSKTVAADGSITETIRNPEPATITGLALWLGFESRQSFYDYEKQEGFSYIIRKSRMKIESEYEKRLSGNNPTGSIFALKNMGWKDKTEQDITSGGDKLNTIQVEVIRKAPDEAKGTNESGL